MQPFKAANPGKAPSLSPSHQASAVFPGFSRGLKEMEEDSSLMEKRFSYKFLKRLLKYLDSAQEFIAHLGQ